MGWFFRILIGIFWVGWFYFWIWAIPELFLKIIFTIPSLEFSNKRIDGIVIFNQSNIGKNKVVLVVITQLFLFK
ncbi:hypothetical protein BPUTSESOX_727 [uncultured Gammaproteobacteria bacterium]|jgi:hypothetical protein|nr:hypothetical protein BPUTSESOX_727 [uncultured Gammaproteobacteria bacterium]